ncbi:MAG: hypothetical protein MR006_05760 [Arcanobacterium sp.]|nr:hypothetical protein [Arcanobacterium sp.]
MAYLSAAKLAERLSGVVVPRTLLRWALDGRIRAAKKLPNGRVVFTEDAVDEILQPLFTDHVGENDPSSDSGFADVPLPHCGG